MPDKKMQEAKSVEPISVLLLPSPALLLAEGIAEAEAKAPRLRAQQRGRVATRKKGRLRAALRHLWSHIRQFQADSEWVEVCHPTLGSHNFGPIHRTAQPRRPQRSGESSDALRPMPPEEKKGRE